ncbi:hypothetical protein [Prauserella cavernicola]|uniref:DUF1795 domain-containing protein n=1 Tax=Prauserella cavernicola TaxID=2800127 RepID=A0A934QUP1_9PSEU|nr:hypothetical protein [Prauserella cavernicola]MBK1786810.1 hypothetical protein [Prauserella cavernicola]
MVATIPVPIEFSLPEGWQSVVPSSVSAGGAAFVALHPASRQGFTANITISGEIREVEVELAEIAAEAVERLRQESSSVQVGRRNEVGSTDNPGFTQAVRFAATVAGVPTQIVQLQVFIGMRDLHDDNRRVVLHVVFSGLPEQFARLVEDFQRFLSTIRPEKRTV